MLSIRVSGNRRSSASSKAFFRRSEPRVRLRHWLAGIPMLAVAIAAIGGVAPAEMSSEPRMAVAVQEEGRWSLDDVRELLSAVQESADEGLDPADYNIDALRYRVAFEQTGAETDALAASSALSLAHDYAAGRIADKKSLDWHFAEQQDLNALQLGLNDAIEKDKVGDWLRSLLPQNEQYRALKAAYAQTPVSDSATRDQLRANLERWRWMPRSLGDDYIYVNVPAYRLQLVENGVEQASYNVVVGAPKTPTPQLLLHAQSLVANPSWTVPQSIIRKGEVRPGKAGYSWTTLPGGRVRVEQAPGPGNALGRLKIDMPNPMAIYLHDTPNKAAFSREKRALSHGCIRVENIVDLASQLRGSADLHDALANPYETKRLQLQKSIPVYLVYFTAQADRGGTVTLLDDPYGRDQALLKQLGPPARQEMMLASR